MNLKHLSLAERQNYENMTVVPILSDTNTPFDVLDLKEGLKMGLVKIEECDNSNIAHELGIKGQDAYKFLNNSVSPLILLDGEEIAGSLQNRIVAQTMIIPPKSEMEIPVNCSEKGRNEYKSEFQYSDYIANSNTRRKKAYNKNNPLQEVVWNSIDDLETDKNTSSKTKALRDSYEKNKYDIDSYLKHFKMENNQIGVICIVENKVGLEIFNNHSLYEKYNEMLLRSYIIDSSNKEKINISNNELENILSSIDANSFIKKKL